MMFGLLRMRIRTYTVEWTGTGTDHRVEIDLYYCGSFCLEVGVTPSVGQLVCQSEFPDQSHRVVTQRDRTW